MGSDAGADRGRGAGYWARREVRRRWRGLLALGLLAGVAGGVSVAAVAGARRTDAAYPRFKAATAAPDAIVFGTLVGAHDADYSLVERLPEVAASGRFALAAIAAKGYPELGALAPADDRLYRTVARPLLTEGRLPRADRVDEVVVNRRAAAQFHLRVGDPLTIVTANDLGAFYGQAPLRGGPTVDATVVGIGDGTMDALFLPDEPGFFPSGELLRRFGLARAGAPEGRIEHADNLVVRLRPGASIARFHRDVAAALEGRVVADGAGGEPVPGAQVPIRDLAEDDKRIVHATDLERIGLLLFGAAAGLASLLLVGQAIARFVYAQGRDVPTLRTLGLRRVETVRGLVAPQVVVAATGAVVAVGTAVLLSPIFPVGLAGRLDPDRGMHLDAAAVLPGAALVALLVLATAAYAGWRASAPERSVTTVRHSAIARAARASLPVSIGLGAGLAVDRGQGTRALPTRPAIVGAVAAVAGVIACFALLHGIDDALATPARSGQVWDAYASAASPQEIATATRTATRDPNVAAAGVMERLASEIDGKQIPVYAVQPLRGYRPFSVVEGRLPRAPGEIALGPASARALDRGIGDRVRLRLGDHRRRVRITGIALLPQTPHSSFDQGAAVLPEEVTRLAGPAPGRYASADEEVTVVAAFRSHPKASMAAWRHRTGLEVDAASTPQDVLNLANVRPLPRALAAFLVLLGIAALGHALVTAVRRRRHELGVLRALGFTRRQTALTVASQAGTVALLGLAIGIPLGILLGRWAWRWVATNTPLLFAGPVALTVILLVIPATIVVANLLAVWPARRAARLQPAVALRSE